MKDIRGKRRKSIWDLAAVDPVELAPSDVVMRWPLPRREPEPLCRPLGLSASSLFSLALFTLPHCLTCSDRVAAWSLLRRSPRRTINPMRPPARLHVCTLDPYQISRNLRLPFSSF